jgi:hypothetical protein
MPGRARAQEPQVRQSMLVADALGQLASTLRAYAQLGHQVEPEQALERLAQARGDFDALLAQLLRRAGKQMPPDESKRLQQRWRSVRDATYTRPSPEIGALMSDIGEDIAVQLRALVAAPAAAAASSAQLERAWLRENLQRLAKEGLFGCWKADLARWAQMDRLKADFSRWLAAQEKRLSQVIWVQYNAQWNLLTTSLPRAGATGCTRQAMQSLVGTTDRLAGMIATLP